MLVRAVLFDLDGVLLDSKDTWYEAFNDTIKKFGLRGISKKEFEERFWGPDLRHNIGELGLNEAAVRFCLRRQLELVEKMRLFPDARGVLAAVHQKYKTGLVTNTPKKNTLRIIEHFRLGKYLDVVVTGDDVSRGKPNPEILLKACDALAVRPAEAVLVGDTGSDVEAARRAGCFIILKNERGSPSASAVPVVQRLSEILALLEDLTT